MSVQADFPGCMYIRMQVAASTNFHMRCGRANGALSMPDKLKCIDCESKLQKPCPLYLVEAAVMLGQVMEDEGAIHPIGHPREVRRIRKKFDCAYTAKPLFQGVLSAKDRFIVPVQL